MMRLERLGLRSQQNASARFDPTMVVRRKKRRNELTTWTDGHMVRPFAGRVNGLLAVVPAEMERIAGLLEGQEQAAWGGRPPSLAEGIARIDGYGCTYD
jgi:hypothetical protein